MVYYLSTGGPSAGKAGQEHGNAFSNDGKAGQEHGNAFSNDSYLYEQNQHTSTPYTTTQAHAAGAGVRPLDAAPILSVQQLPFAVNSAVERVAAANGRR